MNVKKIKILASQSYKNSNMNGEIINKIANLLTRKELKLYIKELKLIEKKKSVIVHLPYPPTVIEKNRLQKLFSDKKIIFIIDPSLIAGIKIVDNDLISELNLKDALERLASYVG